MIMTALCNCPKCSNHVHVEDVLKEYSIPKNPFHVALSYSCPTCEHYGRVLATWEEWDEAQDRALEEAYKRRQFDMLLEIEMGGIDSAQDLIDLWASFKGAPPREGALPCNCRDCKERKLF